MQISDSKRRIIGCKISEMKQKVDILEKTEDILSFMKKYTLKDIEIIKKVFAGKVISRLFLLIQTDVDETISFLINDIRKDILDFEYC